MTTEPSTLAKSLNIVWGAVGVLVYLAMAFVLPIMVPLLGVHSNVPLSWGALAYPFVLIPFLMGFAQKLFPLVPWRLQIGAPGVLIAVIASVAIFHSVRTQLFFAQTLFFYAALLIGYFAFARLGVITSERLQKEKEHHVPQESPGLS